MKRALKISAFYGLLTLLSACSSATAASVGRHTPVVGVPTPVHATPYEETGSSSSASSWRYGQSWPELTAPFEQPAALVGNNSSSSSSSTSSSVSAQIYRLPDTATGSTVQADEDENDDARRERFAQSPTADPGEINWIIRPLLEDNHLGDVVIPSVDSVMRMADGFVENYEENATPPLETVADDYLGIFDSLQDNPPQ